ncbi:hypothetical protein AHiyo6_10230 [Arthrobacter sp. Hiyo6]|nr:hypothetical protein AHiyo6_10230 [Arthrobacter sp. Hiyo6]
MAKTGFPQLAAKIMSPSLYRKEDMKKPTFPVTFAYITGLVIFGAGAVFFAIAWHNRLAPLKTDWGDWATWAGAIGTIAGFAVAIATLWHNDKVRRQAEVDDRTAQARRVGITSTMEIEPATAPWTAHQNAWTEERAHPDIPSVEEQQYLDSYKSSSTWILTKVHGSARSSTWRKTGPPIRFLGPW